MQVAGKNRPEGKGYAIAFNEWLKRFKLDDIDQGDRKRLFDVMDELPAIIEWRKSLPLAKQLSLNHPTAVLRAWQAATREPKEGPSFDLPGELRALPVGLLACW